jgi:histidine triad (HIT) family protein
MDECIFCKIVNGKSPAEIEYEDTEILAFRDINPSAPTHILIIPKKHIGSLNDITEADESLMGKILLAVKQIAQKRNLVDNGYRVVINCGPNAGQIVNHLHFHLLGGKKFSGMH